MALNNHVENFTLDMAPGGIAPVLNVSQGDTGRAYTADMYWGGASYDVSGLTVRLRGRKRDNTVFDYALPAPSGTKVSFDLQDKEQVTIIPGNVECELVFTDSNSRVVGTANFVFIVEESPYDPEALSESDITNLGELIVDELENNPDLIPVDTLQEAIAPTVEDWLDDNGMQFTRGTNGIARIGATEAKGTAGKITGFSVYDESGSANGLSNYDIKSAADFDVFSDVLDNIPQYENLTYTTEPGYISTNGSITAQSAVNKELVTSYIPVDAEHEYIIELSIPASKSFWWAIGQYKADQVWNNRLTGANPTTANGRQFVSYLYRPASTIRFIRVTFRSFDDYTLIVRKKLKHDRAAFKLCPLLMGDSDLAQYIEFDTTAKTMTIPGDTQIYYPNMGTTACVQLSPYGTPIVLNLNELSTSSAKLLFYDVVNLAFVWKAYNDYTAFDNDNLALLAVIRSTLSNTNKLAVTASINAPYKVDGKIFGFALDYVEALPNRATIFDNNVNSINHRGYNTVAPENTLPAFKLSKVNGFDMVETDVHFTSDGVPVCIHDATIDRTSDGTGAVASMTYDQLLQYDFGSWKSSEYAGTKIPSFEEFILLCRNIQLNPYIELKAGNAEQIAGLVDIVNKYGMSGKVTWISFSSSALTQIKNADKFARLGLITGTDVTDFTANIATANGLKTGVNSVFIDAYYLTVTETTMATCEAANIPVEVWDANTDAAILGLYYYVSGVTSNSAIASKVLFDANIT